MKFTPPANDAHKVEIAQFPQGVIQPNIPSQFLVRKNGAKGDIEAKVRSHCKVQAKEKNFQNKAHLFRSKCSNR